MQAQFSQIPLFSQYVKLCTKSLTPLCFSGKGEATDLHYSPRESIARFQRKGQRWCPRLQRSDCGADRPGGAETAE